MDHDTESPPQNVSIPLKDKPTIPMERRKTGILVVYMLNRWDVSKQMATQIAKIKHTKCWK